MPTRSRAGATRPGPRRRTQRGTSAVEFSIIAPLLLALVLGIIETGLYFYARDTAQSAAREGVSYLRLAGSNSDPQSFIAAAEQVTENYAGKLGRLKDAEATGTIDPDGRVSIVVTGYVVLPIGGQVEITQTSSATLEQFRGDTRGGP
jgi:Flp pilus assembly protein TadG